MYLILLNLALAASQPLAPPPQVREMPSRCQCEENTAAGALSFTGIVIDAEMRLAANGRDPDPRQATVFRVARASANSIPDVVKVWHLTDPDDCGVVFDYGRRYTVVVKNTDSGFETDYCIDPRLKDNLESQDSGTAASEGEN